MHATLKRVAKKQKMELKVPAENLKDPAKKEAHKLTLQQQRDDRTEAIEKRSKEQRVQPISFLPLSQLSDIYTSISG